MALFSGFRKARINTCSGITVRIGISNQLLTQIITDDNLKQACHMDDRAWVLPKKQHLRSAMKKQYGISQALRVAMHPDKTFIGKVSKGFDFLRVHLTPTRVTVSDTALSRHEDKVARLYEQDVKPKRIRAYRLRWLVWAFSAVIPATAYAAQIDDPAVCIVTATGLSRPGESPGGIPQAVFTTPPPVGFMRALPPGPQAPFGLPYTTRYQHLNLPQRLTRFPRSLLHKCICLTVIPPQAIIVCIRLIHRQRQRLGPAPRGHWPRRLTQRASPPTARSPTSPPSWGCYGSPAAVNANNVQPDPIT